MIVGLARPAKRTSTRMRPACAEGRALSSVEEHFLHTEGVAGSSPAARTIPNRSKGFLHSDTVAEYRLPLWTADSRVPKHRVRSIVQTRDGFLYVNLI